MKISDTLDEALSKLSPKDIYTDGSHHFKEYGDRLRGGCPWHTSKSGTSFVVSKSTGQWYCSGCHIGGGPLQYLHRLNGGDGSPKGQEFIDLAKQVCERAGVDFPENADDCKDDPRRNFLSVRSALLENVIEFCKTQLTDAHFTYLEARGFSKEDIESLEVGFYDVQKLKEHLKGYDPHLLKATGVLWSKLHGYLVFPWRDDKGRALTLYFKWTSKTPPEGLPKTIALPNPKLNGESCLESKYVPYLFDRTRGENHLVLVEGVTDAALAQVKGNSRVVACVAASLSGGQVKTLKRHGIKSVTIALDPDRAGDKGIESCAKALQEAGIKALVAPRLPDDVDPDEFIHAHGIEAWNTIIEQATEYGQKRVEVPRTFTAAELRNMECREPEWIIPKILPEGSALLVGRPKMGKSFFILETCLAMACGGYALGREELQVPQRNVLYISLEDIERRLKKRIAGLNGEWSANFHMTTSWPKLDQGGLPALEAWLDLHPDVKVVVIDTWGRIKGRTNGRADAYENDVNLMEPLKTMADRRGVSVILVHHARKMSGEDPLDEVSGSTGLTGSVDAILLLRRDNLGRPTLYVRGRDVEEKEYALQREQNGGWTFAGMAEDRLTLDQQTIVDALSESEKPMSSKELAEIIGKSRPATLNILSRLNQKGITLCPSKGVYELSKPREQRERREHVNSVNDVNSRGDESSGIGFSRCDDGFSRVFTSPIKQNVNCELAPVADLEEVFTFSRCSRSSNTSNSFSFPLDLNPAAMEKMEKTGRRVLHLQDGQGASFGEDGEHGEEVSIKKCCSACQHFTPNRMDPISKPGVCPIGIDGRYSFLPTEGTGCGTFEPAACAKETNHV